MCKDKRSSVKVDSLPTVQPNQLKHVDDVPDGGDVSPLSSDDSNDAGSCCNCSGG